MAVGPWHARAHIAACQEKFGARSQPGSGLSFGDNTEHLWAVLRLYAFMLKRMTAARRRDLLLLLVCLHIPLEHQAAQAIPEQFKP